MKAFETINRAYTTVFQENKLSVWLVTPIENYSRSNIASMNKHLEQVMYAEKLWFTAVWLRDVPFYVPEFWDAGQMFDPFTYLGYLAGKTKNIALWVSSIALPLHYPVHVAKSAATLYRFARRWYGSCWNNTFMI